MNHLALAIALLTTGTDAPSTYGRMEAEGYVCTVIETFRTSIIRRDRAAFLALFHAGPIIWQGVDNDVLAAASIRRNGAGAKAAFDPGTTPASFIEDIANDKSDNEERFTNVAIDTDGDIASVTLDFDYLRAGRAINTGREAWHLVRTNCGWKIVSVIYSNRNPV